ncbi:MAG: hypothetical protein ACR2QH_15165 [Geminicoccaceae bacterium]
MNDLTTHGQANQPLAATPGNFGGLFSLDEIRGMPPGMRIMFDPQARAYFEQMAQELSDPQSPMTLDHLKGKPGLAFSIIRKALNWGMDPYDVAQATSTPGGGKLMYEGKLVAAAMIQSGKVKAIRYEHGPTREAWQRVDGKFEMKAGRRVDKKGNPIMYHSAKYTEKDEEGLFVKAIATMHDGDEVETPEIYLNACHPRNATPWAYRPSGQICNVAARVLGQIAAPDVMFGAQFNTGLQVDEPEGEIITLNPDGDAPEAPDPVEDEETEKQPAPTKAGSPRGKRMAITFQGKTINKTNFLRDLRQLVKAAQTIPQLAQLHTEFVTALKDVSPKHNALMVDLVPLFTERREQIAAASEDETGDDDAGYDEDGVVLEGEEETEDEEEFNLA